MLKTGQSIMNIYLDIDGVLIDKYGKAANHLEGFLNYIINKHDVYWLTTHCRSGANRAVEHIARGNNLSLKTVTLLNRVRSTDWQTLKTEAIDFSKDFIWLDDYIMESEQNILHQHCAIQNVIVVNLKEDSGILIKIINRLRSRERIRSKLLIE